MLEQEIIIGDFKIRYSEKRKTEGDIFVFLHGWGSNYKSFSSIYCSLDNYIAFDFPGFGGSSDLKRPLTLLDYAKLTTSFINTKIQGRKIIFIAHSFGGRVLLKLLTENNIENIKQVICIGVPFLRDQGYKYKVVSIITKIFKVFCFILPQSVSNRVKKIWYQVIGASDYAVLENTIMKKTFINIVNEDISEISLVLKNHKTDLIWGSDDKEASLDGAKIVSRKVNGALHVIKNGGHFPFVGETASEFSEVFKEIIKI